MEETTSVEKLKEVVRLEIDKLHAKSSSPTALGSEDYNTLQSLIFSLERIKLLDMP